MKREKRDWSNAAVLLVGVALAAATAVAETPTEELAAAETAFAASMAERDLERFAEHLDDEVVFFTGDRTLRGRAAVVAAWAPFFEGATAPFSWSPEAVEVLASGDLGFTSGPVLAPDGRRVGTFNSVWRRTTADGWRIVFDRGCPPCSEGSSGEDGP